MLQSETRNKLHITVSESDFSHFNSVHFENNLVTFGQYIYHQILKVKYKINNLLSYIIFFFTHSKNAK